jgi:hypothetical protein
LSRRTALSIGLCLAILGLAPAAHARMPKRFFGIAPQTILRGPDTTRMARGGVDSVRVPLPWSVVQPARGTQDWSAVDQVVGVTARKHLLVLPFVYSTPRWVARRYTSLPIHSARQRQAWAAFLRALVHRYGPRGAYWSSHPRLPKVPIRRWQIWNEENYHFFATPASPGQYAALVKQSHRALRGADRGAQVLLGGLFSHPKPRYPRGMEATRFLNRFYGVRGIRGSFEGVAVHPYAPTLAAFKSDLAELRRVVRGHGDGRTGLYVTEFGWGSQGHSPVSFEVGRQGQARTLRRAYAYMKHAHRRLQLKQAFWFSWKDVRNTCNFCDSVGLFRAGRGLHAKPAWHAFTRASGGRP